MMNGFMRLALTGLFIFTVACSTAPTDDSGSANTGTTANEFSDFDNAPAAAATDNSASPESGVENELSGKPAGDQPQADQAAQAPADQPGDLSLDQPTGGDQQAAKAPDQQAAPGGGDEFSQFTFSMRGHGWFRMSSARCAL